MSYLMEYLGKELLSHVTKDTVVQNLVCCETDLSPEPSEFKSSSPSTSTEALIISEEYI
jgi:hypothetical protein